MLRGGRSAPSSTVQTRSAWSANELACRPLAAPDLRDGAAPSVSFPQVVGAGDRDGLLADHADGVVGLQPVLESGQSYHYISGCNLKTEIGKMWGTYTFLRMVDQERFNVTIPEFDLLCPFKMN